MVNRCWSVTIGGRARPVWTTPPPLLYIVTFNNDKISLRLNIRYHSVPVVGMYLSSTSQCFNGGSILNSRYEEVQRHSEVTRTLIFQDKITEIWDILPFPPTPHPWPRFTLSTDWNIPIVSSTMEKCDFITLTDSHWLTFVKMKNPFISSMGSWWISKTKESYSLILWFCFHQFH